MQTRAQVHQLWIYVKTTEKMHTLISKLITVWMASNKFQATIQYNTIPTTTNVKKANCLSKQKEKTSGQSETYKKFATHKKYIWINRADQMQRSKSIDKERTNNIFM